MYTVKHDELREKEVQDLASAVLSVSSNFWDNPNGPYESSCPFCGSIARTGGSNPHVDMSDLGHENNCAYLIAKGLSTNIS